MTQKLKSNRSRPNFVILLDAPKYQKSFWYKMEIVPKLLDLIQKEKDSNTKFEMLHVLVRYSPDGKIKNDVIIIDLLLRHLFI